MSIKVSVAPSVTFSPMNSVTVDTTIDVTALPPPDRHPAIFKTWANLEKGGAILLLNDHDPLPLYYQFTCEYEGGFHWEYLDRGPDLWRVRISKGDFADPGFVPTRPPSAPPLAATDPVSPRVIDTRPLFSQGQTPCQVIDSAIATLAPGQSLVLLVPFEPIPLYAKLGKQGFLYQSKQLTDGTWRVEFRH
jgi:uncharacterized protein (DUF2249 family)